MEINVGDYVRYKEFSYDKEVKIGKKIDIFGNVDTSRGRILEHNITNHSKDIINLIEVGDYVNGYQVIEKPYIYHDIQFVSVDTQDSWSWGKGEMPVENIKSIVTKEQFESNAYTK